MSNTSILANSIWPNGMQVDADGYAVFYELGTNKVDIPTTEDAWPVGDTLISPFVYKNNKLVGFCDTKAMTVSGSGSTTMPYTHIEADFASIEEGKLVINAPNATTKKFTWAVVPTSDGSFNYVFVDFNTTDQNTIDTIRSAYRVVDKKMFDVDGNVIGTWDTSKLEVAGVIDVENGLLDAVYCNMDASTGEERGIILTEFDSDLSSLTNGSCMFIGCSNLTTFTSDLPSLTNGDCMFFGCSNLTTFTSDLSSLKEVGIPTLGSTFSMFSNCSNLTTFTSDLPSLTNGYCMFYYCTNLTTFTSNLSSLTDGSYMFGGCSNLTTFTSELPSLTNGDCMFAACSNLTTFTHDLSSLTVGSYMFAGCSNLTAFTSDLSALTFGKSMFDKCKLNASSVKNIIDTINTVSSGELKLGMGCNNTTEDKDLFAQEVGYADMTSLLAALQAKGWTVTAQYNGRPTTTYGLRRPSEDILPVFVKLEETEDHADYTSEDGSKKFRLYYFHETTGSTEGYTQFNSLEEAIETFNIKQVERN